MWRQTNGCVTCAKPSRRNTHPGVSNTLSPRFLKQNYPKYISDVASKILGKEKQQQLSDVLSEGAIHSTKIQTGRTGKRGPPQKVDQFFRNFSGWTEPIHWVLDRNFRKFWLNGSGPEFVIFLKLGVLCWKLKIFIANFSHVSPSRFWRIFSMLLNSHPTIKWRWKKFCCY